MKHCLSLSVLMVSTSHMKGLLLVETKQQMQQERRIAAQEM